MKPTTINININTLEDVQAAKQLLKSRIKLRELELTARLEQLPEESFKVAARLVLPAFVTTKIIGRSWNVIKDVSGLLSRSSTDKVSLWKDIAKQIGLAGLAGKAFGLFKK